MSQEQLLEKVNNFLENSPFLLEEIDAWKKAAQRMNEKDLENFFNLLKERLEILSNANQLFTNIADKTLEENEKLRAEIPTEIYIADMRIKDLVHVIKKDLIALIKNEKVGIFTQIDQFFKNSSLVGDNVIQEFQTLEKAILFNKEIFTKEPISIGRWLTMYNAFKGKILRKSMDRINFAHQNKEAKKISEEERKILLKILKFYDFLLDPSNVEINLQSSGLSKLEQRKSYQEAKFKREEPFAQENLVEPIESDVVNEPIDIVPQVPLQQENILPKKETPSFEEVSSGKDSAKPVESDAIDNSSENMQQENIQLNFEKETPQPIIPQPVAPELNNNQQQIEELQELLKQYSADSLVYKAIQEEISKLKM